MGESEEPNAKRERAAEARQEAEAEAYADELGLTDSEARDHALRAKLSAGATD